MWSTNTHLNISLAVPILRINCDSLKETNLCFKCLLKHTSDLSNNYLPWIYVFSPFPFSNALSTFLNLVVPKPLGIKGQRNIMLEKTGIDNVWSTD